MSAIALPEILRLSVAERIQIVGDIWDSIAATPDELPLPPSQREELDRRLDLLRQDTGQGASWKEVRSRVKNNR